MVSQHDLLVYATKDPQWILRFSLLLRLEDVEVILVNGNWPAPNHLMWALQFTRVAVPISPWLICGNKRRKRMREKFAVSMLIGWSTVEMYVIQHEQVPEITNGRFNVEVCSFMGWKVVQTPPPHVSEILVDVLYPWIEGCAHRQIPAIDEHNTFWGILDWNKKDDSILAPTIYRTTEGFRQEITTVEMAQVMDFPFFCTDQMKETDLRMYMDKQMIIHE